MLQLIEKLKLHHSCFLWWSSLEDTQTEFPDFEQVGRGITTPVLCVYTNLPGPSMQLQHGFSIHCDAASARFCENIEHIRVCAGSIRACTARMDAAARTYMEANAIEESHIAGMNPWCCLWYS